jgi:hypothetical protein
VRGTNRLFLNGLPDPRFQRALLDKFDPDFLLHPFCQIRSQRPAPMLAELHWVLYDNAGLSGDERSQAAEKS